MANQDVRVSALQSASTLSTNDLALATVVDELSETGYTSKKITEGAKASQYMEAFTFANLNTTAKTIVGAINEAATTGGSDEFIIHMTDTTITETVADIIDAFDNGSEIWLESQITGETIKTRLPLLAYISDSSQLVLRFSGITYANNRYRYCDVQMLRSPEQIVGRQNVNVAFAVIDDAATSSSSVWSSQKTAGELAGKAEIDDTAVSSSTAWSSERIVSLLPTESASGAVASFETPLTLPLVSHIVTIEPVQSGTGDPSPSNVRPISGWSAVNVTRTGKNLFNDSNITENAFFRDDGSLITGAGMAGGWSVSDYINIKGGVNYYFQPNSTTGTSAKGCYYDSEKNFISSFNSGPIALTSPSNACFVRFSFRSSSTDIQLELGTTATTYEPYTSEAEEVEIPLGQTVYGGELDVTNGVLRVTHGITNLKNFTWSYENNYNRFVIAYEERITNAKLPPNNNTVINAICSHFAVTTSNNTASNNYDNVIGVSSSGAIQIRDTSLNGNLGDLKTLLENAYLVYELATPVEITLTPEQINTLKGVNNIWADTGDTTVEFKQDIQTYIDSRLSSGTRSLSLAKTPVETKEETKQEEQEGDEDVNR